MKVKFFPIFLISIKICYSICQDDELTHLAENGDCKFYPAFEAIENCGPKGYLISYGYKYCNKFVDNIKTFNTEGQIWITSVKKCLMKKLLEQKTFPSCSSLTDYAFNSHVDCYLKPDNEAKSFCEIFFPNAIALAKIYEVFDFISQPYRSFKQVFSVLFKCVGLGVQVIDYIKIRNFK